MLLAVFTLELEMDYPRDRVVTWYMGSALKAQNMTGIRAQRNGIRDHKAFEPESGIRFITFHLYYFSFYLKF